MKIIEEKIFDLLKKSENILIVCHKNPDADTLGSASAFFYYFKKNNKDSVCFCQDEIPHFLSDFKKHLNMIHELTERKLNQYDLIITVDCGEIKQTGLENILLNRNKKIPLINIDHHFTNNYFGNINLIDPESSSTSEIIYEIFKNQKIKLDKEILNLLLTGIMSDTTFFSNAATTATSMTISSELLKNGANLKKALARLWKNKNINTLKFWGDVFSRLKYNEKYKIVYTIITQKDLQNNHLSEEAISGLSNFLTNLYQPNIIMVLRETKDKKIKGSLRTNKNNIDVSKLAKFLGGGGHKKAAGFTIDGKLEKTNDKWKIV